MKTHFLALLATLTLAAAQPQPVPSPPNPPSLPRPADGSLRPMPAPGPGMMAPPVNAVPPGRNFGAIRYPGSGEPVDAPPKPKVNYRIRLEIKEGKESPVEISVVAAEGKVRSQMISPKRVVIDDREIPSTLDFTATLLPLETDKCQLTLFLGRSVPYVTGKFAVPGGQQYQQLQIGLDTTVILHVGKPLVIQSDPSQQIKVTLEKAAD